GHPGRDRAPDPLARHARRQGARRRRARRRTERRGDGPERQDLRDQQRRPELRRAARPALPGRTGRRLRHRAHRDRRPADRQVAGALRLVRRAPPAGAERPVFDGAGGFWFTDLGKTRERDADRGAVYYARADGSKIEEAIFPLERPNGIGLSPDEKTLYVGETPTPRGGSFRLSAPRAIEPAH